MPSLARSLALAAVVVLVGCSGSSGVPTPTSSVTSSLPSADVVELPDGPKERPPHPAELTRDAVAEYVRTYESRYAYNSLWYSEHTEVTLDCEIDEVDERSEGWRVVVTCTGHSNTGGDGNGTATATVINAHWFTQTFVYRVGEDSVTRERFGDR